MSEDQQNLEEAQAPQAKKENGKKKKRLSLSLGQLAGIILVSLGLSAGATYMGINYVQTNQVSQVATASNLPAGLIDELARTYTMLKATSIEELDDQALTDGALSGFVGALGDKYTTYLNAEEWKSLKETTDGSFEGVGIEIEKASDYIRVVSPIEGSPAAKGGIQTGDLITAVDGSSTKGFSTTELAKLVRGQKGSSVTLTIQRGSNSFDVTLVRDTIPVTTVKGTISSADSSVGVLRISSFAKTTYDELVTAVTQLREKGAKSFVVDVRSNPGGLLDVVAKVINMFVDNGQVMFQMEDKADGVTKYTASDTYGTFKVTEPVVVLMNGGSASASEIFAGALRDNGRAKLIGEKSFGKGTAQTILPLTANTGVKITYSKWLTPSGEWVKDKGLTPDIAVALPDYANLLFINSQSLPKEGDSSDTVLNLQKILLALGYDASLTGSYDNALVSVIKTFQGKNNMSATGVLDEATATALNQQLQAKVSANDTQMQAALSALK